MKRIGSTPKMLILLLLASFLSLAAEAEVSVVATVESNELGVGEVFRYTIEVSSDEAFNLQEPRLPNIRGIELLGASEGASRQSITMINGNFQKQVSRSYVYVMKAVKAGSVFLNPASIVVNGKSYKTNRIKLKISGQARRKPRRPNRPSFGFDDEEDDLFSQLQKRRAEQFGFKTEPGNPKEAFFIQVEVDKKRAYVGEQVTASWYLYTRGQIRDIDTLKYPSLRGFWKEDIEIATRLNFNKEVVNGIIYNKALLASYALFPIKAGQALIDPYKAKCTVVTFSNFGFGQSYKFTKSSMPIKLEVLELPKNGQPPSFNGAVGNFEVTSKVDATKVPVNQPVTYKVHFEGRGNAKLIDLPSLELPNSLELYDTKGESKFFRDGRSFKDFEILIIPRETGSVKIPSLEVAMFDPQKESYYIKKTPEVTLQVVASGDSNTIASSPLGDGAGEAQVEPESTLPLPEFTLQSSVIPGLRVRGFFWLGMGLLTLFFLLWRARVELGWGQRKKDLHALLQSRLARLGKALDSQSWKDLGGESTNLIYWILGEVTGIGGSSQQIDKMLLHTVPSVRREIEEPIKKLLNYFELISFAPDEISKSLKEKSIAKKNIQELEKVLSRAIDAGSGKGPEASVSGTDGQSSADVSRPV